MITAGLALFLLGVAVLGIPGKENAETAPPAGQKPVEVEVMKVERLSVEITEESPGRTKAYKIAEIRPQATGIVISRTFTEGSFVEQGQQLYQIDPATFKATLDQARADLMKAQATYKAAKAKADRYGILVNSGTISRQTYDDTVAALGQAEADVAVARAAVETAEINLDYTKIRAPISGHIGKSEITPGALVTANQVTPLATITQLDPIYVDLTQPSHALPAFRMLDKDSVVKVDLLDEKGKPIAGLEGALQFSEVTVDESTDTILLRAIFPNPDGILLPGLFVRARLHLPPVEGFLVPHRAALRNPDGSLMVYVVDENNKVVATTVEAERSVGNNWLVTRGLEDGISIVTKGFQKIRPDMMVSTVWAPVGKADG